MLSICKDALQKHGVEVALPVEESAASGLVHIPLPVSDHIYLPGAVLEALLCLSLHDVLVDQALAVIHHSFSEEVIASTQRRGDCSHKILDPSVDGLLVLLTLSEVLKSKGEYV